VCLERYPTAWTMGGIEHSLVDEGYTSQPAQDHRLTTPSYHEKDTHISKLEGKREGVQEQWKQGCLSVISTEW